jgi:hypothetical protein
MMHIHRALNTLAAALVIACMWLFAKAMFDGEQEAKDKRHFAGLTLEVKQAMAAQKACGSENAAIEYLPDGRVQCRTKRSAKTIVAQVAP